MDPISAIQEEVKFILEGYDKILQLTKDPDQASAMRDLIAKVGPDEIITLVRRDSEWRWEIWPAKDVPENKIIR